MSPSSNPELDEEEEANAVWLILLFVAVLFLLSWIAQSPLSARKRKAASLKFEPNALRSTGSVNAPRTSTLEDRFKPSGARPAAFEKFAAAVSIAGERQQKAADEKARVLLEHFSGDPDVEKARAEFEHAQEIKETLPKDFNGIGLS